jgi:D-sedoheptulose 7-phosphate isomerase
MAGVVDAILSIASQDTARVQEAHILCGHILCDWVEIYVCTEQARNDGAAR